MVLPICNGFKLQLVSTSIWFLQFWHPSTFAHLMPSPRFALWSANVAGAQSILCGLYPALLQIVQNAVLWYSINCPGSLASKPCVEHICPQFLVWISMKFNHTPNPCTINLRSLQIRFAWLKTQPVNAKRRDWKCKSLACQGREPLGWVVVQMHRGSQVQPVNTDAFDTWRLWPFVRFCLIA